MLSFLSFLKESAKPIRQGVLTFGRMNPPTAGHEQVVNKLHEVADKVGGEHKLVLSGTTGTKDGKNPLTPEQKLKHAKRAFPNTNIEVADEIGRAHV